MMLRDKVALVFGAGGAVGGAIARRLAAEGAAVHLSGPHLETVQEVADDINSAGGVARAARVDALDEQEVTDYVTGVAQHAGRVDIVVNAIGIDAVQGVPLMDLPITDFLAPISRWTSAQLITARAAARHMPTGAGVILLLSASPARMAIAGTGGFGVACAAVEALTRTLGAELGPDGTRVVCLRPHRIDEALETPDFAVPMDEFRSFLRSMTVLDRLPGLDDVARTAAFLASDGAAATTATVVDLTCGMSVY